MRLHRLEITAFGPFPGAEEIDFDALSDAGLFLIQGRTGAGKTSVLDAVCFALYGQVPGARNAAKGLRSDHAAPGVVPRVVLETTIRGRRLRVSRSPAWERPKLRGTGTTVEHAKVVLEEFEHGAWTGLTTRLDEAGDLVSGLLGMTAVQFCQVALLPQGEFAGFLRAGADDRRRVLERLFATEVFTQVEKWLADRRAAAGREAADFAAAAAALADRVAEATGAAPPRGDRPLVPEPRPADRSSVDRPLAGRSSADRPPAGQPSAGQSSVDRSSADRPSAGQSSAGQSSAGQSFVDRASAGQSSAGRASVGRASAGRASVGRLAVERAFVGQASAGRASAGPLDEVEVLPAWAAELACGHEDVRAVVEELRDEAAATLTAARAALDDGRVLAERQDRHARAVAKRDALAERAEEKSGLASRLDAAARADRVVPLVRDVQARHDEAVRARRWADETRAGVSALVPPKAPEDVLAKAERDRRDEVAALDGRRADAARLRQVEGERAALERELRRLEPADARVAAALDELPGVVAARRAERDEAVLAAAARPGAAAAVQDAGRRLDAAQRRDQVEQGLVEAEAAYRTAVDAAQDARERVQDLRQARLDGMAAVLAGELADGEPCRVCGSPDHPDPAAAPGPVPGEDAVDAAQEAAERAQDVREQAGTALGELRTERDKLMEIAGEAPAAALAAELAEAGRALAAADARAADAERLESVLHQCEQELEGVRAERDDVSRALTEHRTEDARLAAEQARLSAELAQARGGDATLEERIVRLGREAGGLAAAVEALRASGRAEAELAAARARAGRDAAAQGFRTPDEVLAAELADEEQGALRDRIRRLDDAEAEVRAQLTDPALVAAAAEPGPDLPALAAALDAADTAHSRAVSAADRAVHRCERLAELRERLGAAVRDWRPAAERHAVAERLAGLTSGKHPANRHAMSLPAYVLAARLRQVVDAANERLSRMSGGRYALVHTTGKAAGDQKKGAGGLGLRVADAWTGLDRDPVTLSGGESFITSLSLALGLADVVTAEAGGAEIGTLFVDEGFGTLDEETLDEVMDVLDALRDGGRAVGVVSHVAELRARIPAQLRVAKDRAGSTATITV